MEPGDVVMLNDPFHGGTHLPDITLVSPVFLGRERKPAFYVANRAHHSDVGGMSPGSMPVAREIFQEGLILPPVRLQAADGWSTTARARAVERAHARRARGRPHGADRRESRRRDAAARSRRALRQRRTIAYARALQDYTERVLRATIRAIPDGRYAFEDALDDDGFNDPRADSSGDQDRGGRATLDFTGSDPQVEGSVNANYAITLSACLYAFRCLVNDDVLYNAGVARPLTVIAPQGTIVNALRPSAVAGGNVETSQRITDVVLGALGKRAARSPARGEPGDDEQRHARRHRPAHGPAVRVLRDDGRRHGRAARPRGLSGVHTHMSNTRNTPVEAIEHYLPVRIRQYALRREAAAPERCPAATASSASTSC